MISKKQLHFTSDIGRMGNQMFQYACAKSLQWEFGFTISLSHLDQMTYFKLEPAERLRNRVKSFIFFRFWKVFFGMSVLRTNFNCLHEDYLPKLITLKKPFLIWGFFQSPKYFANHSSRIHECLTVKSKYYKQFETFLTANNLTRDGYVAVHFRKTDYKGFKVPGLKGEDFTLPDNYYHTAFSALSSSLPIVIVSDDPEAVEHVFPEISDKIISKNDAITDFLILKHSSECIISNSTFAWWAAWLNKDANTIICPRDFLGFKEGKEVPINIYPAHWIKITAQPTTI